MGEEAIIPFLFPAMNKPEDENKDPSHDAVWELLKKAPPKEASDFFSRNVIREVRKLEADRQEQGLLARCASSFRELLSAPAAPAFALIAAIAIPAAILFASFPGSTDSKPGTESSPVVVASNTPVETVIEEPVVDSPEPAPALASASTEFDPAEEISNLDYLGELMAVNDPSLLDDNALADLLF